MLDSIDLRTLEVIKYKIPVGKEPHGIAFSADGERSLNLNKSYAFYVVSSLEFIS